MIFKISTDCDILSFGKLADSVQGKGDILVFDNVIYFRSNNDEYDKSFVKRIIKKAGASDLYIREITQQDMDKEPDHMKAWLGEYFADQAFKQVEERKQAELKAKKAQLDLILNVLTGKVKIKSKDTGGTSDGERS